MAHTYAGSLYCGSTDAAIGHCPQCQTPIAFAKDDDTGIVQCPKCLSRCTRASSMAANATWQRTIKR